MNHPKPVNGVRLRRSNPPCRILLSKKSATLRDKSSLTKLSCLHNSVLLEIYYIFCYMSGYSCLSHLNKSGWYHKYILNWRLFWRIRSFTILCCVCMLKLEVHKMGCCIDFSYIYELSSLFILTFVNVCPSSQFFNKNELFQRDSLFI